MDGQGKYATDLPQGEAGGRVSLIQRLPGMAAILLAHRPYRSAWIASAAVAVISAIFWHTLNQSELDHLRIELRREANDRTDTIVNTLQSRVRSMLGRQEGWGRRGGIPRTDWETDALASIRDNPTYHSLEWIDRGYIVRWVQPLEGNESTVNLDLAFDMALRSTLDSARLSGRPAVMPPIKLAQGGFGFRVVAPLVINDQFDGFASAVFRYDTLLGAIMDEMNRNGFAVAVLHDRQEVLRTPGFPTAIRNALRVEIPATIGPGVIEAATISILVTPRADLPANARSLLPHVVLVFGLIVAVLLAVALHNLAAARERSAALARLNAELTDAAAARDEIEARVWRLNDLLEARIQERTQKLVSSQQQFRNIVEGSIQGIGILQPSGLVFVNDAFCRMFGYPREELLGSKPSLLHPDDREMFVQRGRARAQGDRKPQCYEIRGRKKDGDVLWVEYLTSVVDWNGDSAVQLVAIDISERKRAEQALTEREALYRHVVDDSLQGIMVCDRRTKPLFVNGVFCRMLGYAGDELLALDSAMKLFLADDRPRIREFAEARGAGDTSARRFEVRYLRKDGSILVAESLTSSIEWFGQAAVQVAVIDITERKNAERLLAAREKTYRELFEGAPVAMYRSKARKIVEVNRAFEKLMGYTAGELIGRTRRELMPALDAANTPRFADLRVSSPDRMTSEHRLIRKDGTPVWVISSSTSVPNPDDDVRHSIVHVQDITARKVAEEQLFQSQKMEALGNLAGGIAHDFNNMLLPIMALTELTMADFPPDNPAQENLATILEAAHQASGLVQQILTFSRQNEREITAVDISECITDALILLGNVLPSTI